MSNIDIQQKQFEKASQELFKEGWELSMFCVGLVVSLFLVVFGIYYSQLALALLFGVAGINFYFNYSVSVLVSALEVAMIKLFGNKERAGLIKVESGIEYNIVKIATWDRISKRLADNTQLHDWIRKWADALRRPIIKSAYSNTIANNDPYKNYDPYANDDLYSNTIANDDPYTNQRNYTYRNT